MSEMAVQKYLRSWGPGHPAWDPGARFCSWGQALDWSMKRHKNISYYRHPELPLWGFRYGVAPDWKDPVVRDARGVVLEENSWDVVARPFRKFFNVHEDPHGFRSFDWATAHAYDKVDGSLIILYSYESRWLVNTSGGFGHNKIWGEDFTWAEAFWHLSRAQRSRLNPALTYCFELWTPANSVVTRYDAPMVVLLGATWTYPGSEVDDEGLEYLAAELGVPVPSRYKVDSLEQARELVARKSRENPGYEGVILKDGAGSRWKLKSPEYLRLHKLWDNGNLLRPRALVPLVLSGEIDEVEGYFPDVRLYSEDVKRRVQAEYLAASQTWEAGRGIQEARDFALFVTASTRFYDVMFRARRSGREFPEVWRERHEDVAKLIVESWDAD